MTKAKAKTSKKRTYKKKAGSKGTRATTDLTVVRQQVANLVGTQAVEMVQTTIAEVGKGHYAAMKYLFEMVGLYPAIVHEEAPEENSLAKTLLRRLALPEEPILETEVTKEYDAEAHPEQAEP